MINSITSNMMRLGPIIQSTSSAYLKPSLQRTIQNTSSRSMTIISKQSAEDYKKQNYSARMSKTGRPVSPHVSIYSFPIAALTSIAIRISGMSLSIGAFGVACLELTGGSGSSLEFVQSIADMDSIVVPAAAKTAVAFPFIYHYLGGLRHFYWDTTPEVLTTADVEKASYAVVGGSVILTTASLFL